MSQLENCRRRTGIATSIISDGKKKTNFPKQMFIIPDVTHWDMYTEQPLKREKRIDPEYKDARLWIMKLSRSDIRY